MFMRGDKQMRNIIQNANKHDTDNSDFSSFNCVKRSSLVRSNDAVESVECHTEYQKSTTEK